MGSCYSKKKRITIDGNVKKDQNMIISDQKVKLF